MRSVKKKFNQHRALIPLIFFILLSCSLNSEKNGELNVAGNFSIQDLKEREIFEFRTDDTHLYAGTSKGLVRFGLSTALHNPQIYMANGEVRTFLILEDNFWLISAGFENKDSTSMYKSTDQGQSWIPYNNGFGGDKKWVPGTMDVTGGNPPVIFARSYPVLNVARSIDKGKTWESVLHSWDNPFLGTSMFVKIDVDNPEIIWAGGSNAFFEPNLVRSEDSGENWEVKNLQIYEDQTYESKANDIVIQFGASSHVLLGLGIGILKSTDNGETWNLVFDKAGILTFAHSARDPGVVYASGVNTAGTLFFLASDDFGDTWQTVEFSDSPAQMQVNDMVSVLENGKEVLYFATNQGVYSYTFEE